MNRIEEYIRKNYRNIVIAIFVLSVVMRIIGFGFIPASYQWDELSSAYESFNLLNEGTDRWGNKFPVYFLGWGSGQNALLAYSAIPFIKVFGLSPVAIRMPLLITGILTIIFIYLLSKKLFGRKSGFVALLLAAFLPWNFMMSRWGLESNMLPFFVVSGIYLLLVSKENKKVIPFALIPFALGLYAYAIFAFVLPFIILGYIIFERTTILRNWKKWLLSLLLFLLIISPFLLFFIKNYITKADFGFESSLPFSIVQLPISRTEQLSGTGEYSREMIILINIATIISGFIDGLKWNSIFELPPFTFAFIPLFFYAVYKLIRGFRVYSPQLKIIVPWFLPLILLLFLFQINLNRANFVLPLFTILMAFAIVKFYENYNVSILRRITFKFLLFYISFYTMIFFMFYFVNYRDFSEQEFQRDLQPVFEEAKNIAGNKKIFITQSIPINYLYPLAFDNVTASELKKDGKYYLDHGDMNVRYYKNYFFNLDVREEIMNPGDDYVLLTKSSDYVDDKCIDGSMIGTYDDGLWKIVECKAKF